MLFVTPFLPWWMEPLEMNKTNLASAKLFLSGVWWRWWCLVAVMKVLLTAMTWRTMGIEILAGDQIKALRPESSPDMTSQTDLEGPIIALLAFSQSYQVITPSVQSPRPWLTQCAKSRSFSRRTTASPDMWASEALLGSLPYLLLSREASICSVTSPR